MELDLTQFYLEELSQAILDRGYGKPAQTIDARITEGDGVRFLSRSSQNDCNDEKWLVGNPVAAQRNPKS